MEQQETKKDDNLESVADLEVSGEQAEEIQAGVKLENVLITGFQHSA